MEGLLLILMCLIPISLAQLGSKGSSKEIGETPNRILYYEEDPSFFEEFGEDDIHLRWEGRNVQETYQGCISASRIAGGNATFTYIDLTQMSEIIRLNVSEDAASVETACLSWCFKMYPFSELLSVQKAFSNNSESCGCHMEEDINKSDYESSENMCNFEGYLSVYCSSGNMACFNSAHRTIGSRLLALLCGMTTLVSVIKLII